MDSTRTDASNTNTDKSGPSTKETRTYALSLVFDPGLTPVHMLITVNEAAGDGLMVTQHASPPNDKKAIVRED